MKSLLASIALLAFAAPGSPQAVSPAKQSTPAGATFDKLESLVGEWEGNLNEGGQQIPAATSFRLVSDGSVLMNVLGGGHRTWWGSRSLSWMPITTMKTGHSSRTAGRARRGSISAGRPKAVGRRVLNLTAQVTDVRPGASMCE
jgi:hypothetical protein